MRFHSLMGDPEVPEPQPLVPSPEPVYPDMPAETPPGELPGLPPLPPDFIPGEEPLGVPPSSPSEIPGMPTPEMTLTGTVDLIKA
jgi:hypothetical protein